MDTPLPDEIRQSLHYFTESLGAEDQEEATELLLLALAATYAARARRRGKPPPDWIAQIPCYPPKLSDVRRLVEEIREVMGDGPDSARWTVAAEWLLADAEIHE